MQIVVTEYHGYKFQGRLEARWALFLDVLGVRYEYKPKHRLYSPTFWIPSLGVWLDVNPQFDEYGWPIYPDTDELGQLVEATGNSAYVFGSIPSLQPGGLSEYGVICDAVAVEDDTTVMGDNMQAWCECWTCGNIGIAYEGRQNRLPCAHPKTEIDPWTGSYHKEGRFWHSPRLIAAYKAAREARFEYGMGIG